MHLTREKVHVILDHVESRSRRRQATPIIPPRRIGTLIREGQRVDESPRAAMRGLGALTSLTSAYVFGHVDVLADPERKAVRHSTPGAPARVGPRQLEHKADPPRPHRTRNVPPFEVLDVSTIAPPCRSTNLPSASAAPDIIGPNSVSVKSSAASFWTNAGDKKRSSEGTDGAGAVVAPVPSVSSAPASATNILVHVGDDAPPHRGSGGIMPSPPGRLPTWLQLFGVSSPSLPAQLQEAPRELLLTLELRVARRGGRAITVRETATRKQIHRIPGPRGA